MLSFSQLPYLLLSDLALGFWASLLQQASQRGDGSHKGGETPPLPLGVAAALIDLAGRLPAACCAQGQGVQPERIAALAQGPQVSIDAVQSCTHCQGYKGKKRTQDE